MFNQQFKMGIGAVGIAIAVALLPAGSAWAGSHKSHHKTHHKTSHSSKSKSKSKVATTAATCPSATTLGGAAGVTYTTPMSQPGAEKGWLVCTYGSGGSEALLVSLYTTDDSLRSISANVPVATTKVSGIGNAASHYGTEVYVQRDSAPSFSVIDSSGSLTLTQTEDEAKAIANGS